MKRILDWINERDEDENPISKAIREQDRETLLHIVGRPKLLKGLMEHVQRDVVKYLDRQRSSAEKGNEVALAFASGGVQALIDITSWLCSLPSEATQDVNGMPIHKDVAEGG